MSNEPIIIERTFHVPSAEVWEAITDKSKMKKWYFDIGDFQPVEGFKFQFLAGDDQIKYLHLCKIIEVINQKKLAYSWSYDGYQGSSLVTFDLFDEGSKTRLRLTHQGLETLPKTPAFFKENFVKGWNHIIGVSLKNFLEIKREGRE